MGKIKHIKIKYLTALFKRHLKIIITFNMLILLFGFRYFNGNKLNNKYEKLLKTLESTNSTNYTWLIDRTSSWEDFQKFLPLAKMSGIIVQVSLLPPSEAPPINPTGSYSEPYRLDFITWAKEIANLSLRYSNIKGYYIKDIQENIDLGYLTQTYVDSIGNISSSINPKLQFKTDVPNVYYVSTVSSGDSSGNSWANKKKFNLFNRSQVNAGDTVYIDGGADSLVYTASMHSNTIFYWDKSGSSTNKIVMTKGKDVGHNGKVIFQDSKSGYVAWINCNYIELSYMTFENGAYDGIFSDNTTGLNILHCTIKHPYSAGIKLYFSENTRIMYDSIYTGNVNYSKETDNIQLSRNTTTNTGGSVEIAYCYINQGNVNQTGEHQDCIQGYPEWGGINKIHHNIILNTPKYNLSHVACIYTAAGQGTYQIYDNIIAMGGHDGNLIGLNKKSGKTMYASIYNNTLAANNGAVQAAYFANLDSLKYKNNILYEPSGTQAIRLEGTTISGYTDIDYNQYYESDTSKMAIVYTTKEITTSWSAWKARGYDANGNFGKVDFANVWGNNAEDYKLANGSNCIDTGTIISLFNTDIIGTKRPKGQAWDKGALEQ